MLINFLIFEVSYLLRAAFDISLTSILDRLDSEQGTGTFFATMFAFLIFDGIPYTTLLLFHRKNFSDKKLTESEIETASDNGSSMIPSYLEGSDAQSFSDFGRMMDASGGALLAGDQFDLLHQSQNASSNSTNLNSECVPDD